MLDEFVFHLLSCGKDCAVFLIKKNTEIQDSVFFLFLYLVFFKSSQRSFCFLERFFGNVTCGSTIKSPFHPSIQSDFLNHFPEITTVSHTCNHFGIFTLISHLGNSIFNVVHKTISNISTFGLVCKLYPFLIHLLVAVTCTFKYKSPAGHHLYQ